MNTRRTPEELFNAHAETKARDARRYDRSRPKPRKPYEQTAREMALDQEARVFVRSYLHGPETTRRAAQWDALFRRLTSGLWERLHAANRAAWDELDAAARDTPEATLTAPDGTAFRVRVTGSGYLDHGGFNHGMSFEVLALEWPEGIRAARRLQAAREAVRELRYDAREWKTGILNRNAQRRLGLTQSRGFDERAHYLTEA